MSPRSGHGFLKAALLIGATALYGSPASHLQAQTIKVGGTGAALGTMKLLAESFEKSRPGAKVVIVPGLGSGGGRKALSVGAIDIAVTSKAGKDAEKLDRAVAVLIGRTPLVFATSQKNPASALTTQALIDIWNGKRTTWADGSRLRLVLRPETDSDTDVVKRISPAMEQAIKNALTRDSMKIAVTDGEAADAIEAIQGAMGTSSLALIISEKRSLKALTLDGVAPSPKTIADGSYPYFKSIYALTGTKPSALTEEFMAFLRGKAGQEILTRVGHWVVEAGH
jgi:phosphate transport system substrate-binding protein